MRQLVEDHQEIGSARQNRDLAPEEHTTCFLEQVHRSDDLFEADAALDETLALLAHGTRQRDDVVFEERGRDGIEVVPEEFLELGLREGAIVGEVQRVQLVPMIQNAVAVLADDAQNDGQAVDFLVAQEMVIERHSGLPAHAGVSMIRPPGQTRRDQRHGT